MQIKAAKILAILFWLSAIAAVSQEIPPATVLPVMLTTSLDARRSRPGQVVTGKMMQDVPLRDGAILPKGARITGHIVSISPATAASPSRVALRFDRLVVQDRPIYITTNLRALASMTEVFQARLPTNAWADYGTSTSDWNTVQVGGAGVYRGNGQVVSGDQIVGRATDYGAVTAKLIAAPRSGCQADDHEQALWVFSPWACGTYGFSDLKIARSGKTDPLGEVELESSRDIHIDGGSGWLLRVEAAAESSRRPAP